MILNKPLTPHQSLKSIFEKDIHVNHISEVMKTCQANDNAVYARKIMMENDFDCLSIEENGKVVGYVDRDSLGGGVCRDYLKSFSSGEIVSETTSLIQVLYLFKETKRIFVLEGNKVTKVVTHADLQKTPVHLLLFGLVSIVEMYLLKIIKSHFDDESWKQYLKEDRIQYAETIFTLRKNQNEEIDLSDCLQLCDKRTIVLGNEPLFRQLGFESKTKGDKYLKALEKLRNNLAHAQEFTKHFTTEKMIILVEQTVLLLEKCEIVLAND